MTKRMIPEESKNIVKFIDELGGITDQQLDLFLGKKKKHKEFYVNSLRNHYIKEDHGVYTSKLQKVTYPKAMEYCVWVLLHNFENSDETMVYYSKGKSPLHLSFLKDEVLYNVCFIDPNSRGTLVTIEQQYLQIFNPKQHENMPVCYLFVINDLHVLDIIKEMNMQSPHKIAYVQLSENSLPQIDYYK